MHLRQIWRKRLDMIGDGFYGKDIASRALQLTFDFGRCMRAGQPQKSKQFDNLDSRHEVVTLESGLKVKWDCWERPVSSNTMFVIFTLSGMYCHASRRGLLHARLVGCMCGRGGHRATLACVGDDLTTQLVTGTAGATSDCPPLVLRSAGHSTHLLSTVLES
jgi:hypothetical protein